MRTGNRKEARDGRNGGQALQDAHPRRIARPAWRARRRGGAGGECARLGTGSARGANATWDEPSVTGFADSLGASSKVWYTIGDGELENAFYPETDTPDTFGLQYAVTDGSTFTELETTGTAHSISLLNNSSLVWKQVNTADNGDFTITKTYIPDPSRSVILVQTTFDNTSSTALSCTSTITRSSTTTGWATPATPTPPAVTWSRRTAPWPAR